jgi:Rrf2 family nitric oxide-sensitive transcriptional repressor
MRLTNMTDYAMRLLMYLGRHPDRLCTIAEIARAYSISEPHLMKITHRLALRGWIRTVRGKHGGMELAHAPRDIRLGAVIRDMENDLALVECMGASNTCTLRGQCGLTHIVEGALRAFMDHLDRHTLADLLPPVAPTAPEAPVRIAAHARG